MKFTLKDYFLWVKHFIFVLYSNSSSTSKFCFCAGVSLTSISSFLSRTLPKSCLCDISFSTSSSLCTRYPFPTCHHFLSSISASSPSPAFHCQLYGVVTVTMATVRQMKGDTQNCIWDGRWSKGTTVLYWKGLPTTQQGSTLSDAADGFLSPRLSPRFHE